MNKWYTITPLHNLVLSSGARFQFAGGLVLDILPDWIRNDTIVKSLDSHDQRALDSASHCFAVEYEAASLGDPDPTWKGARPRSIQHAKCELTILANLAVWLSRPSPVCFVLVFHAPRFDNLPLVQRLERHSPLVCHPRDFNTTVSSKDLRFAQTLHSSLTFLPKDNAVWTAVRATWAALQMNMAEVRYLLFWIALEALFGPEDARETTFRLSQRLALFLGEDACNAHELFAKAKKGYTFRSKVAHGRWKENAETLELMADVEAFVRRSLVRLMQDQELMKRFLGRNRENYLDGLAFMG